MLLAGPAAADPPAPATVPSLTGHWVVASEYLGAPRYFKMDLVQDGAAITGNFDGDRLKLNRDYAVSGDGLVPRGLTPEQAVAFKDAGGGVRWHLDLAKGLATSEKPGEHLGRFAVPVKPMLGCVGTAPGVGQASAPNTGDSGRFGGNMDFNEVVEGTTVYLPVNNPGALLYFGDGHAVQGDGELTGDALEGAQGAAAARRFLSSEDLKVSLATFATRSMRWASITSSAVPSMRLPVAMIASPTCSRYFSASPGPRCT